MAVVIMLGLLAAPGRQVLDSFEAADAWRLNADGGGGVSFEPAEGAMRIAYDPAGTPGWGNLRRDCTVPEQAVALTMRLQVRAAQPGAAMYVWLFEADGDAYMTELTAGGKRVCDLPHDTWHEVRIALGSLRFEPRGDQHRRFLTVDRVLLGCNYEPLEVLVDDLSFEMSTGRAEQPLPRTEDWRPARGERGSIAILDEPRLPRTEGAADPNLLERRLGAAGYGVTHCRAGDLADSARLNRETFDLLILPASPAFPLRAREQLLAYLKQGGAFLALGGYAFDSPVAWFGDGWDSVTAERTAATMDAEAPPSRINSRFGEPGDTMALQPDQIGLFDPSCQLDQVAYAGIDGRRIDGALTGWAGVSLAGLNSPVFPDQHGETETIGQCYDAVGRPRGAVGVLAHFYAGPFAGAAWGGVGVENRDLIADGTLPLEALVTRLIDDVYLHGLTAPYCVRPGEQAPVSCQVANRGRIANDVLVRFTADGEPVGAPRAVHVEPGQTATVQIPYTVRDDSDFVLLEAVLQRGDAEVMRREAGLAVWREATIAAGPKAAWQGNYLTIDGRPTFLTGTNQTGVMWHSPRENPLTWERDFAAMADRGMTVWRVLHFSPFGATDGGRTSRDDPRLLALEPPEETIRKTDAMVLLAQRHRLVLMICAHDWIPVEIDDETLEAERRWNRFWAERYRDVPGIIWDIQNEPSVYTDGQTGGPIPELWREFRAAEYPNAAIGELPARHDDDWASLPGVAYERFRLWLLQRWVAENIAGLREGDPDAVITVGYLHVRYNAEKLLGASLLDFSNMHTYESPRAVPVSFRMIDRRAAGRGLSLGEFGQRNSHDMRVNGQTGIAEAADRARFLNTAATVFGAGGAFCANWCFRDLPDVIFPWGLHRFDRVPRPWADEFLGVALFTRGMEPTYEPPAVYLLMPDESRLGPLWGHFDRGLYNAVDTLLGLSVPFAVLTEGDAVPPEARAILWPMAYAVDDAVFEKVRAWVAAGGHLYLSGDPRFDPLRQPTRAARFEALGLPPPAATALPATAAAEATIVGRCGAGRVTHVQNAPEPAGGAALRERYAALLGVATPPPDGVMLSEVADRRGGRALVALCYGQARRVTMGGFTADAGADRAAMLRVDDQGRLLASLADGAVAAGGRELVAGVPACVVASDAAPLAESRAIVALPLADGVLRIATQAAWTAPVAVCGTIEGGRFVERARLTATVAGGTVSVAFGPEHTGLVTVIAEPAAVAATAENTIGALHLRW